MKTKSKVFSFLGLIAVAMIVMGHAAGITGQTASPSETTCTKSGCHTSFALNSGTGSIVISHNIPATGYVPGQTYSISVTVSKTGVPLFGFDFEALKSSNTTAGTLIVTSSTTTQVATSTNGRQNITHKTNGGFTSGTHTFSFNWRAPVAGTGTVTFYGAGLAANKNNSDTGDYAYTTSLVIPESNILSIVTGIVTGSPFCEGQTGINISYNISGTYTAGNIFTAQLSDATGSFASPLTIGTLSSTAAGTIVTNIPLPSIAGTLYRVRVISSTPAVIGSDNGTDLIINLNPTNADAGLDQTVCGTATTLAGNTPASGIGTWSLVSGTGNVISPSNPTSAITGLGAGNNIFKWTVSTPCGTSSDSVIITGITPVTTANAGSDQTACTSDAVLAGNVPASGTGTWTLVSGVGTITSPSNPSSTVTGLGAGANTFRWTISNPPCTSSTDDVIITQTGTITVANAGPDQTICSSTAILAGNTPTAGTGLWSLVSGSGSITTSSNPSSTLTGLGIGANIFRWTISNGSCNPSMDDVIINVTAPPTTSDAGADQSVCTSFTTLAGNTPSSGTGIWTVITGSGTFISALDPTSDVTGLSIGYNTFRWTITNSPCASSVDDVNIIRSGTITVADAGTDQDVCGTSAALSGNTVGAGETGTWSLISGSGTITSPLYPSSNVTGLASGSNTFRWTITNGACVPTTDDVIINVASSPTVANAGTDQNICSAIATLAANTASIGTGTWSVISGTGIVSIPGNPTSSVTNLSTGINKFVWTISNNPCTATEDTVVIIRDQSPTISNAGPNQNISSTSTTMAANTPAVGMGNWSLISGSGTCTNPSSPTTTVTGLGIGTNVFQWTISNGTCTNSTSNVTITNNMAITTGTITGNPFCASTSYSLIVPFTTLGIFQGFYTAELSDASGSFLPIATVIGSSSTSPISAVIPSSIPAGTRYRIRVTNSNPVSAGSDNGSDLEINNCNPLLTGTITGSPFCKSTSYNVSVPFTFTGAFAGPFIAQLSDLSGSFASPLTIGYGYESPIAAVIPSGLPSGNSYRIRISDFTAGIDGVGNDSNLSVNTCAVGIAEYENGNDIIIYPNPVHGVFNLSFNKNINEDVLIEIYDVLGSCKLKQKFEYVNQSEPEKVEVENMVAGFYLIKITIEGKSFVRQLSVY
jgi:hypothetical protein